MESSTFKVMVQCMTYNHAPYITDTLNGFTIQKTEFPYVCIIIDDASTDAEPEVIQKYLDENFDLNDNTIAFNEETDDYVLIFSRHKINQNCFFAVFYLKYNHYSINKEKESYYSPWSNTKYIAFCEGDDYWTSPYKLQKQVDILECNGNLRLVHTDFCNVDEDGNGILRPYYESLRQRALTDSTMPELFRKNFIMTLTCCCTHEVLYSHIYSESPTKIDYTLFLSAVMLGDIAYIDEKTGCYRMVKSSLVNSHIDFVSQETKKAFLYFVRIFFCGEHKQISKKEYHQTKNVILRRIIKYRDYSILPLILRKDILAFVVLIFLAFSSMLKNIIRRIVR